MGVYKGLIKGVIISSRPPPLPLPHTGMRCPQVIKKRIESLIEREFLERDSQDRKLYRYLA